MDRVYFSFWYVTFSYFDIYAKSMLQGKKVLILLKTSMLLFNNRSNSLEHKWIRDWPTMSLS